MKINGKKYETIWEDRQEKDLIHIIDQRSLPFEFIIADLKAPDDFAFAISEMLVRGAPLIGVTGAYGMYAAALQDPAEEHLRRVADRLAGTRPTAIDLSYAIRLSLDRMLKVQDPSSRADLALETARELKQESINACRNIGLHGLEIIRKISRDKKGETVNVLTHCNAGWLACIDYGTATAPVYMAFDEGIDVHVWVDETRPRSQGARLTAFELGEHGVPHTLIADNTGGHLMQHGLVDLVITGTDRTTRKGDVANKIGTYLKALAARDNGVPFYVALPSSTIDWDVADGIREIPIETRDQKEVTHVQGWNGSELIDVRITPEKTPAANYGFDVTPAAYVTALITDRGISDASESGLLGLYPERK